MERLHEMLPQDEIFLCGLALLVGVLTGAVARCLVALRNRRPS